MSGFRLRRWTSAACFVLGWTLAAPELPAESTKEGAVLVLGAEDTPLTKRLRAELRALGLQVLVEEAEDVSLSELEVRARATGVALALSTSETSDGVELRLVDRVTGKMLLREVLERDLSSKDPDSLIALRALELLRASLLELELEHPPRGEVAATESLLETTRRSIGSGERLEPPTSSSRTKSFEVGLLAGLGTSVFAHLAATRPELGVSVAVWWQPTAKTAVGMWSAIPLDTVTVSAAEGAADVRSHVFGAGLRLSPRSRDEPLLPTLGAGASLLWLSVTGTRARSDLVVASEDIVAAGPYAEIGCGFRVTRWLTLRADTRAVVTFPKPVIEFADREVTSLGRPLVSVSVGLEYRAALSAERD